jgi:hypothetical protein
VRRDSKKEKEGLVGGQGDQMSCEKFAQNETQPIFCQN